MPFDLQAVSRFKSVAVALLGVLVAALGIWAVGLFGDYFEVNPQYAPVSLTNVLGIDLLGALAPIIAAFPASVVFFKTEKAPIKKFATAFLVSIALAFLLCHATPDGLSGYPLMYALLVSLTATAISVYPKPFVDLQRKFVSTIMLALACVPLSLFFVDLAYSPSFSGAVIGGNGLTDGLLLSTLYAPATVTGVFFALFYASQMVLLVQATASTDKTKSATKTGTVSS